MILILNVPCSNVAITWSCKHLSYSTTEAFFGQFLQNFKAGFDNSLAGPQLWITTPPFNIKSGKINVWWGFLFIFRVLDKQDAFHDGIPEDKNAGLHVPCSFLIQLLRAHSKNLGFVGVSLSKVGEG